MEKKPGQYDQVSFDALKRASTGFFSDDVISLFDVLAIPVAKKI